MSWPNYADTGAWPRFERGVLCAKRLQTGGTINARWLMDNCHISLAQAKRDLVQLERLLPVRRDNGTLTMLRTARLDNPDRLGK